MIRLHDKDGEIWLNEHHIISMRPFGHVVEIIMRDGSKVFAKDTTCDRLSRRIDGSDI